MPIVPNASNAADFTQGRGLNDFLRRNWFPGLPPTECISGYVFFPWGTGPTFPIPCDRGFASMTIPGGAGSQFVGKPGSAFVDAVAELAETSRAETEQAVAKAAGIDVGELANLTVLELGRKIFESVLKTAKVQNVPPDANATIGDYFKALAKVHGDIEPDGAVRDLSEQTGLSIDELQRLPLSRLSNYLDVIGDPPGGPSARTSGTTVCIRANGQVRCAQAHGWVEGFLWGSLIGGALGGGLGSGLGAAIGAAIGALIGWLLS